MTSKPSQAKPSRAEPARPDPDALLALAAKEAGGG
jgi:hypothetical protein